jgi:type I restriction enzyme, S subunit
MSNSWTQAKLSEILDEPLRNGISPSTAGNIEAKVLTLSAITGASFDSSAHKVGHFRSSPPSQYRVNSSDLLICRGNGNRALVGRGFFPWETRTDLVFPDTVIAARISRAKVNLSYVQYLWNSPIVRAQIEPRARTTNGTFKINHEILNEIVMPLPPIADQSRIAEILDHADELLTKRRETITLLNDLARSIFLDTFGQASVRWPLVAVEDLAAGGDGSIRTGPFGSQLLHEEFVDSGIGVLGIDNVTTNEFRWNGLRYITEQKYNQLARYTVHPGDVLITIMGTCGRCAIVPDGIPTAINTKHLCCITLDQERCLPEFLHSSFLIHPDVRSYLHRAVKGAIMSGLNMKIIKALPIRLPPIEIQRSYAAKVRALRMLEAQHLAHHKELDALYLTLQYRAFRGELRRSGTSGPPMG